MKPTKETLKVGKEKGTSPINDELVEIPTLAPNVFEFKGDTKGKKSDDSFPSPTLSPTFTLFPVTLAPTFAPTKFDPKAPSDGKMKSDDAKGSPSLSPTKDPKGATTPKGAPEDLDAEDDTGLEPKGSGGVENQQPEPKGEPKTSSETEDTDPEPKGNPKGSGEIDDAEPEPKGPGVAEDTEPESKGASKGSSEPDEDTGFEPKGAPKGSGEGDDADPEPKGAQKGLDSKGDPKDGNVFVPAAPTKEASPPVEVHMIGVKLANKPPQKNGAVVTIDAGCSQASNMVTKKLSFSTTCLQDPTACGLAGDTKKNAGKRNLRKTSCTKSSKSSKAGSKKRHV